jgi:hypothetical protein
MTDVPREDSERLDNAPLHGRKYPDDTHIAGEAELATAVRVADAENEYPEEDGAEMKEMERDAEATLADGMGADDARTEMILDDPDAEPEPDLRTDLPPEPGDEDEDEDDEPRLTGTEE